MRKFIVILFCTVCAFCANAATIINDTETERVLYELITPIARAADIDPARMKIHIINGDDFNAFVMGGEDIYIYTGLLREIRSPDALAAVVAHELGHTIGGHMAQMSSRMEMEMKRAMVIQALGIGLMFAGGNPALGAGVLAGGSGVARQSLLAFSRDEERIADELGLKLLVRAGLPPDGFITVFQQMSDMHSAIEAQINPTHINHPLTSERLANIRARIAELHDSARNKKIPAKRVAQYELVRAKLIGYLDVAMRVNTLYPESDKSDAAQYARAIANMRTGKMDMAVKSARNLSARNPNNPYFYELVGDLEYQLGDYDAAVAAYEHSLRIITNAPQIETALALVLIERGGAGDTARAADLCRRALLVEQMPITYWTLARTFDASDGRADWAMAEYYNMNGDSKNAKKYARRAREKLSPDTPEYKKSGDLVK
ncbi:MAG: M48 family metalloprotease [Alphaproteobacteria bacterium]|nr:M48 family metalloprotease [Alphaproteobacteria bacterium]